uniref:collagen alpha-3(VI) chain-like n=1 Tax=Myxine glutinosa TaxID=7769 RepID=UPI00358E3116
MAVGRSTLGKPLPCFQVQGNYKYSNEYRCLHFFFTGQQKFADVVFLLDGSDDVTNDDFSNMKRIAQMLMSRVFQISKDGSHAGLTVYGYRHKTEFTLNTHDSLRSVQRAFQQVSRIRGRPRLGQALRSLGKEQFTQAAGSRMQLGNPQVLIILTASDSTDDVTRHSKKLKDNGVIVFAMGAGKAKHDELQLAGSTPPQSYVFFHRNFADLFLEITKFGQTMEEVFKISIDVQGGKKADVVFLLDGSKDIGRNEFEQIKKWVETLVGVLHIDSNIVQVGVAQYGQRPRSEFYLNTHKTIKEMQVAIQNIQPMGGPSKLYEGLELLRQEQFVERSGSRAKEDTIKVAIVLVGSKSQVDPRSQANALQSDGVKMFAVGAGNVEVNQLNAIASKPPDIHSFYQPDILAMSLALPAIGKALGETLGAPIEIQVIQGGPDIILLLDGSSAVGRSDFVYIRLLASHLIAGLDIGPDQTHVAVVQYGSTPHTEFDLDGFMDQDSAVNAINRITYRGGRSDLAGGLQHVLNNVMVEDKGSRKERGAPQLVLILTGSSPDNLAAAKKASKALQEERVMVMAVGAGRITERQLQEIVSVPADTMALYHGSSYTGIERISTNLLGYISTAIGSRKQTMTPTTVDLVFLLDGSHNIALSDFDLMKHIVETIVGVLDVGQDKTQVGMVQFGGQPRSEFYLNTYRSNAEITDALQNFKPKGGQSNLREGLELLRRDQFVEGRGGRAKDGAMQVAIILSGSTSVEDPTMAAKSLQEAGVNIFAMGAGKTDKNQLLRIGDKPTDNFVFYKEDYLDLAHELSKMGTYLGHLIGVPIEIQVHTKVITHPPESMTGPDIVFLLDGSNNVGSRNFELIRQLAAHVTKGLNVAPEQSQVAVVQYGSTPRTEFNLISHKDKDSATSAINRVAYRGGRSNLAEGLRHVQNNVLVEREGGRGAQGAPQLVLILSGSSPDDIEAAKKASVALQDRGVTVMAVGAGRTSLNELQEFVSQPVDKKAIFHGRRFQGFGDLSFNIYDFMKDAGETPIAGTDNGQQKFADVVFLLDGSDDVTNDDFSNMKRIAQMLMSRVFQISKDGSHAGLTVYGYRHKTEFTLNTHDSLRSVQRAFQQVSRIRGRPRLGQALRSLGKEQFTQAAGSRMQLGNPQVLIILTASDSTDDVTRHSKKLKDNGVIVFAMGAGKAKHDELQLAGSTPPQSFVFFHRNFADLFLEITKLGQTMEEVFKISIDVQGGKKADVVFLLDGSRDIGRNEFEQIKKWVEILVGVLHIDSNIVQVGVAQYGQRPRSEFYLNTHKTIKEMQVAIQNIQPMGGPSKLHEGLELLRQEQFVEQSGSRAKEDTIKVAIVLVGSKSQVDPRSQANALQSDGVKMFAVGAGNAEVNQLNAIASKPPDIHSFYQPDILAMSLALPAIGKALGETLGAPIEIQVIQGGILSK